MLGRLNSARTSRLVEIRVSRVRCSLCSHYPVNSYFTTRHSCPCCGGKGEAILYEKEFCESPIRDYLEAFYGPQGGVELEFLENAAFTLVDCPTCGLIYQKHVANDALMVKLYEQWIHPVKVFELIDGRHDATYFLSLNAQIANAISYLQVIPADLECLDFGMGWGHWCRAMRGFGCNVTGTELSESRISYARKEGLNIIDFDDIGDHKFDLINSEQVLEHIPDPFETLLYLRKSLKPGGLIRIGVPDGWDVRARLAVGDWLAPKDSPNSLNAVAPLEHINCFNYDVVVRLATRAGLEERFVPAKYAISLVDALRKRVKPVYFRLRRRKSTELYFARP